MTEVKKHNKRKYSIQRENRQRARETEMRTGQPTGGEQTEKIRSKHDLRITGWNII
jgi:hypothetical protein